MLPVIDAQLLQRAAHDDDAFRVIQERYVRLLWATTASFRFDRQTREDIVQLVWMKLVQHVGRIREPERLAGWLAATTRNECIRLTAARSRVHLAGDVELGVEDVALDTRMIRDETVRAVASALNNLSPRCQELLRLLSMDPPPSYEEISTAMEMPVPSIGPTRQRCLKHLANQPQIVRITGGGGGSAAVTNEDTRKARPSEEGDE